MLTKEIAKSMIDDCLLRMKLFKARNHENMSTLHNNNLCVRVYTTGMDGGGLSTYGKYALIGLEDHYECHHDYLYIHREQVVYGARKELVESVTFIPYEAIVAIECSPTTYI